MLQNVILNEAETMKTWSGFITESTGVTDRSKLTWMTKYCAFHDMHEKAQLNESVHGYAHLNPNMNVGGMGDIKFPGANPGNGYDGVRGSGDNPFSLLPLAVQVAAQTIALDLVPVVPMQGPLGILQYMDYVYEGGRTNRHPYPGVADKSNTSPLMVKVTFDKINNGKDWKWTFEDTKVAFKPGEKVLIYNKPGDTTDWGYELTFVAIGRIDGKPIFQVKEKSFHTDGYVNGGEGAALPLFDVLSTQGVRVNVVNRDYDKVEADHAAANGEVYPEPPTKGTFQVLASDIDTVKALEDFIPGYTGAGFKVGKPMSALPYTREAGESTPSNMMSLNVFTEKVEAKTIQVKGTITREQIQDLKAYGIDALAQVEAELVNELTQHINREILNTIFELGYRNYEESKNFEGINLKTFFTVDEDPDALETKAAEAEGYVVSYVGGGAETLGTIQRRIMSKILAASNLIAQRGRRGAGTFAVCSAHIATALQDCAGFVAYPLSNTVNQTAGSLFPVGSVAGVSIYVDPNMPWFDNRVVVGRKGKDNEPGVVFMPYLMADKLSYPSEGMEGAPVTSLKSRYAIVKAGHHPQLMYYTFDFKLGTGVSLI